MTVPPGSTITVHAGLAEQQRGTLSALLNALTTTVSFNSGSSIDLSSSWSAPGKRSDGSWLTTNDYATGVTLAAGQQLQITYTETLAHRVPEVVNPSGGGEPGQPAFNEAGPASFVCTVTAT